METPIKVQGKGKLMKRKYPPIKIALVGKLRSGKDTVAGYLEYHGFSHYKLSMGITDVIHTLFPELLKSGSKNRMLYQKVGQSMREINPNVWLNYTYDIIVEDRNIVISDVRQKNEEEYLRERGFIILKIESSTSIRVDRALEKDSDFTKDDMNHETENSVDEILADYIIQNESTRYSLYEKIDELLNDLRR